MSDSNEIPSEMLAAAIEAILRSRQLDPDGTLQQNKDDAKRDALAALEAAGVPALLEQIASMQAWRDAESGDRVELEASAELRYQADQRAIQRWQAAHPDMPLTWPDHADLCIWLMALVAELEAELAALREFEVTNRAQWQALLAKAEADRDFAKLQAADNAALTEKASKYAAHLLAENEKLKSESGIEAKSEGEGDE